MTRALAFAFALLLLAVPAGAWAGTGAPTGGAPEGMARVGGGLYTPLYLTPGGAAVPVRPFYLDRMPVTNADFLAFVRANPEWRRSRARALFVDEGYLAHWAGDLELGDAALARRPVVNVSWFAAEAYARWRGHRLPTTAEWEFAAFGRPSEALNARVRAWYSRPTPLVLAEVGRTPANAWGVRDLVGLVWEWTADFNNTPVVADSRGGRETTSGAFCGAGAVGAGDFRDYAAFLRFGYRAGLQARYTVPNLGFRTALDAR